jgi:general secretion pathway protein J
MKPSRATEEGFTLIEALAAVALTAAILAGLATIAGQWLPAWRHGFTALQNADRIGLALDRIAEDVGGAEYARPEGGKGAPLFRGESSAVAFVRRRIGPGATPRLEIVRIGLSDGGETQRVRANFAPGVIGAFGDAATLLAPPFRVAFAYAGKDGRWLDVWNDPQDLPRAVRATVLGKGGDVIASTAFALKLSAAPEIAAKARGTGTDDSPARAK